jgi:hypothetical protein
MHSRALRAVVPGICTRGRVGVGVGRHGGSAWSVGRLGGLPEDGSRREGRTLCTAMIKAPHRCASSGGSSGSATSNAPVTPDFTVSVNVADTNVRLTHHFQLKPPSRPIPPLFSFSKHSLSLTHSHSLTHSLAHFLCLHIHSNLPDYKAESTASSQDRGMGRAARLGGPNTGVAD